MNIDQVYTIVKEDKPQILYISGKTSTGKSTLAKKLSQDFGYQIIELDEIVYSAVVKPINLLRPEEAFLEVYRHRNKLDWIKLFLNATNDLIAKYLGASQPIIIEGAIANPITLNELFSNYKQLTFVYIHPKDIDKYIANLTNRFIATNQKDLAGLPHAFWKLIDPLEFEQFCDTRELTQNIQNSIKQYATSSQKESLERLESFKSYFSNIVLVEI